MDSQLTRRLYLASTASLAALAGCTDDTETDEIEDQTAEADSDDETEEAEDEDADVDDEDPEEDDDEEEEEPTEEAVIEMVDHELVVEEDDISTTVYVEAMLENTGAGPSGRIDLEVDWYDEDGNYLDDGRTWLLTLPAETEWEAHIYHLGSGDEDVADYEIDGEFGLERPDAFDPEGLEVVDSDIQVGERDLDVTGEIINDTGDEASYIQAIATLFDEDGVVLGDARTNVSGVPDGETWAFDMSWNGRDRIPRVDDYELHVTDSTV